MGIRILRYYKYITDIMGPTGRVELAKKTRIASIVAGTTEDSEENMNLFIKAVEELTGKPAPKY